MSPPGSASGGGQHDGVQTGPPPPLHERLELLARQLVPDLDEVAATERAVRWTGSRPLTPDCQPIIGLTAKRNLLVNTGGSFNGWRQASLSAELLAKVAAAQCNSAMGVSHASLYGLDRFGL
jgi:D-amino-acid dehydrogenase